MKRRPVAGARARDGLARRLVDGEHVAAVDAHARHPVADRLVGERLGARLRGERRRDRPLVVVAEEDERRLHHGGEVRALVERALGGRAVAEVRDRARRSRRAASCPRRDPPRAARGWRSGRRSRRRCSRRGSTSPAGCPRHQERIVAAASRAAARSPTRGSSGRSSRRPRARGRRRPASPRGPRRSRRCRCGPGGGRRPSARRRCAAAPSSGRARAARARRALDLAVRDGVAVADHAAQVALRQASCSLSGAHDNSQGRASARASTGSRPAKKWRRSGSTRRRPASPTSSPGGPSPSTRWRCGR